MSGEFLIAIGTAAWLGILTSISPCPLATNVAAVSFIARRVEKPRAALATGLLYAVGRSAVYVVLGALLVASVLAAPSVSHWLQKYMNKILGPLLILVGMILLDWIHFRIGDGRLGQRVGERVRNWGVWAGLALGVVFAMSFCPSSAALFFGSLVPLSVRAESPLMLPAVYGVSTALPVIVFAVLIAFSARAVGRAFERVAIFEGWARRITGAIFVLIGIYFSLRFIFGVV
ncbi:MAG TPA: aromatic aminobenezylarsenical efflux permease ArsG family transporter [Phycisphaerae bacterium]|nr:aromatic aminobenezylarsenical efflux permease ArsG family transporter [Phycisphaerae bacterium]